ncbi:BTB/POZ protein [Tribonema minus]|uniref:BTB/POZ protein n=1 Tax=Tribonema minus TaxID=303371 RepID=A0A835ZEN3_9STRA|nr:BTB/POZ protein [Tribonema minus]
MMAGAGSCTAAVVELNVGGALFTTTRSTLAADPDSMLARLVNGNLSSARDAQRRLFIDRDGSNFNIILQYLRNRGRFSLPTCLSQEAVEALQQGGLLSAA